MRCVMLKRVVIDISKVFSGHRDGKKVRPGLFFCFKVSGVSRFERYVGCNMSELPGTVRPRWSWCWTNLMHQAVGSGRFSVDDGCLS